MVIHLIGEGLVGETLCGKWNEGDRLCSTSSIVDCKSCLKSLGDDKDEY